LGGQYASDDSREPKNRNSKDFSSETPTTATTADGTGNGGPFRQLSVSSSKDQAAVESSYHTPRQKVPKQKIPINTGGKPVSKQFEKRVESILKDASMPDVQNRTDRLQVSKTILLDAVLLATQQVERSLSDSMQEAMRTLQETALAAADRTIAESVQALLPQASASSEFAPVSNEYELADMANDDLFMGGAPEPIHAANVSRPGLMLGPAEENQCVADEKCEWDELHKKCRWKVILVSDPDL